MRGLAMVPVSDEQSLADRLSGFLHVTASVQPRASENSHIQKGHRALANALACLQIGQEGAHVGVGRLPHRLEHQRPQPRAQHVHVRPRLVAELPQSSFQAVVLGKSKG